MSQRLITPSAYQQAIFNFVRTGRGHGVIHATAGSGKTVTLVEVAYLLPKDQRALFLAFNLQVARELQGRLPKLVQAMTLHALGFRLLRQNHPELTFKVEPNKLTTLTYKIMREDERTWVLKGAQRSTFNAYLTQLATFIRLNLTTPDGVPALVKHHQQQLGEIDRELKLLAHELVWRLLDAATLQAQQGIIDYTDMMFLPIIQNDAPKHAYDLVLVDEAQDLTSLSTLLVQRVLKQSGRLLAVGDQQQAIYGFAGSDTQGLERLTQQLQATSFPLSVTYRCPGAHVRLARQFSAEIEAAPAAQEGTLRSMSVDEALAEIHPRDLVLCRLNAPLIKLGLQSLSLGTPVHILGQDVIGQLERDMKAAVTEDLVGAAQNIERYTLKELARIERSSQEVRQKGRSLLQRHDELSSLAAVTTYLLDRGLMTKYEMVQALHELFAADRAAVFSSVHKAKGKEAERVFILYPQLMPLRLEDGTELAGETCVQFVAVTRAKDTLVFIEDSAERTGWWRGPRRRQGEHHAFAL